MLVNLDCPVELLEYQLYKSKSSGKIYLSLRFNNVSSKVIRGLKAQIYCYDQFGDPINGEKNNFECKVEFKEGLYPKRDRDSDEKILLSEFPNTREIEIDITKVLFDDNAIWDKGISQIERIELTEIEDQEILAFLNHKAGNDARYFAKEEEYRWICVCGRINEESTNRCKRCEREKDYVLTNFSSEDKTRSDLRMYEEKKAEEERKAQEEKNQQKEIAKQKVKKVTKIVSIAAVLVFIIGFIVFGFLTKFTFSMETYHLLKNKDNALIQAVKDENIERVNFLLKNGADANFENTNGEMAVVEAVKLGNLSIVERLIENGALIAGIGENRNSILHLAVEYEQINLLDELIKRGYDIKQKNKNNYTIFGFALLKGKKNVVEHLVTKKIFDINNIDSTGKNAIHIMVTVRNNESMFLNYFIEKGVNINSFDKEGNSPLFYAIKENNQIMADLLMVAGADSEKVTNDGKSAYDIATLYNEKMSDMFKPLIIEVKIDKQQKNINLSGVTLGTKKQKVVELFGEPNDSAQDEGLDYDSYFEYNLKSKYGDEEVTIYFYEDSVSYIQFKSSYNLEKTLWYKGLGQPYQEDGVYYQEPGYLLIINENKKEGYIVPVDNNYWKDSGKKEDYINYIMELAKTGSSGDFTVVKDITRSDVENVLGKPDISGEYWNGMYIGYKINNRYLYFGNATYVEEKIDEVIDDVWVE